MNENSFNNTDRSIFDIRQARKISISIFLVAWIFFGLGLVMPAFSFLDLPGYMWILTTYAFYLTGEFLFRFRYDKLIANFAGFLALASITFFLVTTVAYFFAWRYPALMHRFRQWRWILPMTLPWVGVLVGLETKDELGGTQIYLGFYLLCLGPPIGFIALQVWPLEITTKPKK